MSYGIRRVAVKLILEFFMLPLIVGAYYKAFSLEIVSFGGKLGLFCSRNSVGFMKKVILLALEVERVTRWY